MPEAGTIVVTRPEPGGAETAARLERLGYRPILAPALVLTPRRVRLPRAQALILTSRAAARALTSPIAGLPVIAVGAATAEAARQGGWRGVTAAGGTAAHVVAHARRHLSPADGPLVLAVGQAYALDLAQDLRAAGFRVIRRVAYAATPATGLPEAALRALRAGQASAILFHSPRSARCAITLLREAGLAATATRMVALAISPRVAAAATAALAPLAWPAMRIAARPDEAALLALLGPGGRVANTGREIA